MSRSSGSKDDAQLAKRIGIRIKLARIKAGCFAGMSLLTGEA